MSRAVAFERAWLASAEGHGDDTAWISGVLQRLVMGDDRYGESYRWASLTEQVREVAEEALDLGGWTSLIAESLDSRPELTELQRERLAALLTAIAGLGARAHELAEQAQKLVGPAPKDLP